MAKLKGDVILEDRNRKMDQVAELEKKVDAADHVNQNLKAIQVELEEKLRKNEEAYFSLQTKKYNKRYVDKREIELGEIITALKHDLELAKAERYDNADEDQLQIKHLQDCNKEWKRTYGSMKDKLQQVVTLKELYEGQLKSVRDEYGAKESEYRYEVERLTGELRGANFCFQKLTEEICKGGS